MHQATQPLEALWRPLVARWSDVWELPGLAERVHIEVSARMRVSLGQCRVSRGEIRITECLLDGPSNLLEEVLYHEVAHAAVGFKFGTRARPHGREWRGLMRDAGVTPRVRLSDADLAREAPAVLGRRVLWQHRCPVCQACRMAGRPVRAWRCATCGILRFGGRLEISRVQGGVMDRGSVLPAHPDRLF